MGKKAAIRAERAAQNKKRKKIPYKVGLRLELTFNEQETQALQEFQAAVNSAGDALSLEHLCRQSIFLTITESWKRAQALQTQIAAEAKMKAEQEAKQDDVTTSGDTKGNPEAIQLGESATAVTLAETQVPDAEAASVG